MRLTLSMIVRDEENRYLRRALESARQFVTDAVVVDDGSSDRTMEVCCESLRGIPFRLIHNQESRFSNEHMLRKQQWDETVQTGTDWILTIDADEIFEDAFASHVRELIQAPVDAYYFRLYDFWNEAQYRDDQYWSAHRSYRPFLVRNTCGAGSWRETAQHCGRFPVQVSNLKYLLSDLRLRHYGWAKPEDRAAKYSRYMQLDPNGVYGWKEQYESILDPNPNLVAWQ